MRLSNAATCTLSVYMFSAYCVLLSQQKEVNYLNDAYYGLVDCSIACFLPGKNASLI
ncbi:hypothetical protein PMIT1320_00683 [Prochlorococcus marinus str. MIT 1320]|nr:hypothetical protein PMIT1320_00683 [Prochlorococcus marinus str. MIT 1320]